MRVNRGDGRGEAHGEVAGGDRGTDGEVVAIREKGEARRACAMCHELLCHVATWAYASARSTHACMEGQAEEEEKTAA